MCNIVSGDISRHMLWNLQYRGHIDTRKDRTQGYSLDHCAYIPHCRSFRLCTHMVLSSCAYRKRNNLRGGLKDIYQMILDIVPKDIVSPFLNGNTPQIIFLGTAVGVALLILGDRVSATRAVTGQMNEVVSLLMETLTSLISFFAAFLDDGIRHLEGYGGDLSSHCFDFCLCTSCVASFHNRALHQAKVKFTLLLKKLLPTFLIGVSTSSSIAAFAANMETYEKRLGIDHVLSHFAVPLGQVIFKPGALVCPAMAEIYSVAITPVWMVTMVIVVALLSMAAPPIPGGALTCY